MQLKELKNIKRFKEIASTLVKYGFDEIVDRLDVPGADWIRNKRSDGVDMSLYARIRSTIEDLGPTFIKFGQILSLRSDLLPQKMLEELEKLQDNVAALAVDEVEKIILDSLGQPIEELFSIFDVDPIAAASLSQVHKAVLKNEGHIVSVKVQRPEIRAQIQSDLDILEALVDFLDQQFDEVQVYDLPQLVQVIRRHLMAEIDFSIELRNLKIARAYASDTPIYIPEGYEAYSTPKVLVMELVQGARYSEVTKGSEYDGERIAKQGLSAAIKQILEDGFFHADPHPGNLLVNAEMNLCIIDWGMVGRLTEKDRFELTELLRAIVEKDSDALLHSLLRLCQPRGDGTRADSIERDLLAILETYHAVPIKQMNVGQLLMDLMGLIRDHRLRLPTDYVIMIKALVTAEGSARRAHPELNVVAEVKEKVLRLAKARFQPEVIWRNLRNSLANLWAYQRELPRQIQQIVSKLDQGELSLQLNHHKLEHLASSLENASNRLTIAIIAGAIIVGSSMIITTGVGPYLFGFPALGVIGYLLSVILGLWLIVTIIRTK